MTKTAASLREGDVMVYRWVDRGHNPIHAVINFVLISGDVICVCSGMKMPDGDTNHGIAYLRPDDKVEILS